MPAVPINILKKIIRWLLLAVLMLYGLTTIWLYCAQRSLLYFPQPLSGSVAAQTFTIASQSLELRGWVINPGQERALLYFGGNGEQVELDPEFFQKLLPGISIYLLPYRGYAGNQGMPTEAGLFADALQAYDAIAEKHTKVDVIGRSLGSGVAVHVASNRPVGRLVLVTPYDSIQNVAQGNYPIFPIWLLLKDKFESWQKVAAIRAPTLVLIAGNDRVIPRANTDYLIAQFVTRPAIEIIPGAGHNSISSKAGYGEAIRHFLDEPK